jgi:hypothetical protein
MEALQESNFLSPASEQDALCGGIMYELRWQSVSYALIFIAWLMVWSPVCIFLLRAWRARRDLIFDFFDDEALRLYYAEFFPAEDLTKLDAVGLKANFRRRFYALYGRRFYLVPILLLADGSLHPYMVWRAFRGWFPDV